MNIIANNVASKLFVAFVAAAMLFTLATPSAKAATAEELQAQIAALMAQISALQGGSSSSAACTFTRSLTVGMSGEDVKCLQQYLTPTYFSNAGGATGTFGPITQAAVAAWQSANGISPAAGYFGPVSQAKYNAMAVTMPGGSDDSDDDSSDDDDDNGSVSLSGEATLDTTNLQAGEDTDVEEGASADVAELELEFTDGDAQITRIDLDFGVTGTEDQAWDTFEEVALVVDGDEVASIDTSDEDNWLNETNMTLRFGGLDIIAEEDEEMTIVIRVTAENAIDLMPAAWNVDVTSLRYLDADDVSNTETIIEDAVSFDVEEAGGDDELIVKTSTDDVEATTLQLESAARSDWHTVFAFDLDTDDSVNDIELDSVPVTLTFSSSTYATMVNDVELVIDGTTISDVAVSSTTIAGPVLTFDVDGDVVIDAGDRVTAELRVKFNALAVGNEGVTVVGSVSATNTDDIVAEGADTLSDSQTSGAATGKTHTLRTEGVILDIVSKAIDKIVNTTTSTDDDEGLFTIKFDVEAFETDVWVNKTAASGTTMGTAGANFLVEDNTGTQVAAGTSTASLSSTADTDGTRFVVRQGQTKTFTLTVEYDPTTSGFYQVQLYGLNFTTSNANPTTQQRALPDSEFTTDQQTI